MGFAIFISLAFTIFCSAAAYGLADSNTDLWIGYEIPVLLAGGFIFYRMSRRHWHRKKLKHASFPEEWDAILTQWVGFYRGLDKAGRKRFQYDVQCFLAEKSIKGVKTEIDDTDRLLVAASAVIPIFGFAEWEYTNLNEVLLYPYTFGQNFELEEKASRNVSGMVGSGYMNGMMILSRPQLRRDFEDSLPRHNVGIHEFVHLLDKSDGEVDGLPQQLLDKQYSLPWMQMMHEMTEKIKKGKVKDINPYAATGAQEFLAVTSEYFFERPAMLKEKHPELYAMLSRIFHQKPAYKLMSAIKDIIPGRRKRKKNIPCPCKSGKKFADCCGTTAKAG